MNSFTQKIEKLLCSLPEFMRIWLFEYTSKFVTIEGRANRAQYWYSVLSVLLVQFGLAIFSIIISLFALIPVLGLIFIALNIILSLVSVAFGLFVIIPGITVTIRRLHDTNKSAWWILFYFILYFALVMIGVIIFFVAFGMAAHGEAIGGGLYIFGFIYLIFAVLTLIIVPIVILAAKGTVGDNKYGPEAKIELFTGFNFKKTNNNTNLPKA